MPHWLAPTYQQNQQTTAPCLPKLFASCWENVTSSKPVIAANLSRDYNRMSSKDCPHPNQQVPRPTPVPPVAKLPVSTFIINSDFISLMLCSYQGSAHPKILFKEKQLN